MNSIGNSVSRTNITFPIFCATSSATFLIIYPSFTFSLCLFPSSLYPSPQKIFSILFCPYPFYCLFNTWKKKKNSKNAQTHFLSFFISFSFPLYRLNLFSFLFFVFLPLLLYLSFFHSPHFLILFPPLSYLRPCLFILMTFPFHYLKNLSLTYLGDIAVLLVLDQCN